MAIDYTKRTSTNSPKSPAASGGKVVLTKSNPTVSLTKSGGASGSMRLNLQWSARAESGRGLFGRSKSTAIDLDLGCLYDFTDGSKGVVQALGNAFTASTAARRTIIRLDGDDRSGSSVGGENLSVDLSRPDEIRRILFFAMIYDGVPNWAAADGVVTVYPASGPVIETRLDNSVDGARICAVAMLERSGSELVLRRENQYVDGSQRVLDQRYGWGLRWTAGSK